MGRKNSDKMKKARLILMAGFCASIVFFKSPAFAVTGLYLDKSENPLFSCMVLFLNDEHIGTGDIGGMCSGEFIGKKHFLTAGHCNDGNFDYAFITCSESDKQHQEEILYTVTDFQRHPEYSGGGTPYDQMILSTDRDFPFAPVNLPENQSQIQRLLQKEDCVIFGYGLANNNSFGKLFGISAEFNGALFGPDMVGLGGFSFPRPGDSGAGLLCREKPGSPWIRIGTVSQTEIGLANVALLSPSLNWILEQADHSGKKMEEGQGHTPSLSTESRSNRENTSGGHNAVSEETGETYDQCVSRLRFAAEFSDYIKENMEHVINMQCGLRSDQSVQSVDVDRLSYLRPYLGDKDLDILFGQDSFRNEENYIQTVSEAYNFQRIRPEENLCDLTKDNLIADGDSGIKRSAFTIETRDGEETEFMVEVFSGCLLTVSYPYSYSCQSCGTWPWGQWNPIVQAQCDNGIYINAEKTGLICETDDQKSRFVNLNYLRFLNQHKKCFAQRGLYDPLHVNHSAEATFFRCVYKNHQKQWFQEKRPLSLCSLNQLLFENPEDVDFWITDYRETTYNPFHPKGLYEAKRERGTNNSNCIYGDFVRYANDKHHEDFKF